MRCDVLGEYILEMQDISKQFGGNYVLQNVHFNLKPGEVHALVGENGAGKSTMMKILMGIYNKDGGKVLLNGKEMNIHNPKQALEHGIAMIHQELNPIPDMEISENLFTGKELIKKKTGFLKLVDKNEMRRQTAQLLDEVGLHISPKTIMRKLSVAQTQLVEIAKAICWNAQIIIMDEPTSALTEKEVKILFKLIRKLCESNKSVIYISHRMEEIFTITNRITVLRDGKFIGTENTFDIDNNELIKMMVGREITEVFPKTTVPFGDVVMEVKDLSYGSMVRDVSFTVRAGEILGIAGLIGAGRSEMVETIFGIRRKTKGKVVIKGKEVGIYHPKSAIRHKVAMITEDRKLTGLNLVGNIKDNITIVSIKSLSLRGLLQKKKESSVAQKYIGSLKIKARTPYDNVSQLSGGNQQKVVLAKWLVGDPDIIIMDEPTRGIDVGAKRDIYLLMGELVKQGKAIIMISSEMPEVMGMSDNIIVLSEGQVSARLSRSEFNQELILKSASNLRGFEQ
jgi:ABC-type sugar transport system ATPase subunit